MMNFSPNYNEKNGVGETVPFPYSVTNKSVWEQQRSDSESETEGDCDIIHHDLACHYGVMGSKCTQHIVLLFNSCERVYTLI